MLNIPYRLTFRMLILQVMALFGRRSLAGRSMLLGLGFEGYSWSLVAGHLCFLVM